MPGWLHLFYIKMKKKVASSLGTSMAEMLVCTILFSLAFMAGISGLLMAYDSTSSVMKASDAQTLSDIILDRIEGELTGMAKEGDVYMPAKDNCDIIGFTSSSGIPMYICSDDNGLLIYYKETRTNAASGALVIPKSEWRFDQKTYQGYKINSLKFTSGERNNKLTLTMDLVLQSSTGKTYESSRTVCCYNRENAVVSSQYNTMEKLKAAFEKDTELTTGNTD